MKGHKLNIIFIGSYYPPYMVGGAERMFKIHAEELALKGHKVSVITLGPNSKTREETIEGLPIYRMPVRNIYWPLSAGHNKLSKVIWHILDIYNPRHNQDLSIVVDRIRPDIVICENIAGWSPAIWKFFHKKGIPVIQFVHDASFICASGTMFHNRHRCPKTCIKCAVLTIGYKLCCKYASHFIFVSHSQQRIYQRFFAKVPSSVMHNAERLELRNKAQLWDRRKPMRLGLLGCLSYHKGVIHMIKAFKMLHGNFQLYLGGNFVSKAFKNEVLAAIGNDPRIRCLGYVNSIEFFNSIDLTIVPSLCDESFGLVAIESCACGVPVIASNHGGLVEIVKDGINGLCCDTDSPENIAKCIQKVYESEQIYRKLAANTHSSISPFINPENLGKNIEDICNHILNTNEDSSRL